MNKSSWRAEDGQLLRSLREEAGVDELVFARHNTISLAQLRELERGGQGSFYNPGIKRSTGTKLLKKLGHELAVPEVFEAPLKSTVSIAPEPSSNETVEMAHTRIIPPKSPARFPRRKLIQQTFFWGLSLLSLVALTAIKPWDRFNSPEPERFASLKATPPPLAPTPPANSPPDLAGQAFSPSTPPAQLLIPGSAPELKPQGLLQISAATVTSTCDWQHRNNSKTHTPNQPLKPGNYVHLEAQADMELCVLDSQNQKTILQLKAGTAKSVYGSAPFLVHSQDLQTLKLFFQGRRVHEALNDMQYLLLNSQPL